MRIHITFLAGSLGVLLFSTAAVLGGVLIPGYSPVAQFISESYASGTPHGPLLRFGFYLPSGLLIALFVWSAARTFSAQGAGRLGFVGVGLFYGLGTVVTAFFPCDAGCEGSSLSQVIHDLSGLLTYMVVPPSLIAIGAAWRGRPSHSIVGRAALLCGTLALIGFGLLIVLADTGYKGLLQRMVEGSILSWIMLCALRAKNGASAPLNA